MKKRTILITGAGGQLGQEFRFWSNAFTNCAFIFTDRNELDITKLKSVTTFFAENPIDYVVNCAAYTAVDRAETDEKLAANINVLGAKHLAQACQITDATMIQLSTDYVYHSKQNIPFKETDPVSPKGVYARTKLRGDLAVLKNCDRALVIRTSWVYGVFGHNFVKTMLRLGKERPEISVVFDQIGTPTAARDLAKAIIDIILKIENQQIDSFLFKGIWHYSNEGVTSWYDFAKTIFELRGMPVRVKPIETMLFPTPAKRPPFSVLNKDKIKKVFGIEIPHWRESLIACLKELP
ncbi:MAG: dTDP-4-dehydrorhamnose reductase [Bacteroidota bacterium]|jgi:dTDP-4-dehydrorhamnose reductase